MILPVVAKCKCSCTTEQTSWQLACFLQPGIWSVGRLHALSGLCSLAQICNKKERSLCQYLTNTFHLVLIGEQLKPRGICLVSLGASGHSKSSDHNPFQKCFTLHCNTWEDHVRNNRSHCEKWSVMKVFFFLLCVMFLQENPQSVLEAPPETHCSAAQLDFMYSSLNPPDYSDTCCINLWLEFPLLLRLNIHPLSLL